MNCKAFRSRCRNVAGRLCAVVTLILAVGLWLPGLATSDSSRTVEGRTVDAETGEAIPYPSVGAPQLGVGTVGDESGHFELTLPKSQATIVISAIGYRTLHVESSEWEGGRRIDLTSQEFGFREEITVTAEASGEAKIYGKRLSERGYGVGYGSASLGAEIGALIRIGRPTFLESAHFTVAHTGGERFLYRVNVYEYRDGKVGRNLLQRNVTLSAKQERGTLEVDLRDQGLIVDGDLLLGLEWIQDDRGLGNANVMFRAKPRARGTLFLKPTSQMQFRRIPRHNLGFYLTGYPLPRSTSATRKPR